MFEVTADMFLAGGNAVILYAAKYSDVRAVVNISGRFDLERGMEGRLGKDFRQRIKQDGFIDVKNRRGKLSYAVILVFHEHQLSCLSRSFKSGEFTSPSFTNSFVYIKFATAYLLVNRYISVSCHRRKFDRASNN